MKKFKMKKKHSKMTSSKRPLIPSMLKGLTYSYLITAVFFTLLATLLTVTNMFGKESTQNMIIIFMTIIAVMFGAKATAKSYGEKGWLMGGILGLIYYAIFFLIAFAFNRSVHLTGSIFSMFLLCVGSGILGGFLGMKKGAAL